ncbi:hypothetical protein IscW_ISCW007364 [Ixodes scapularis]|uniref:Uncharacterized protein n=1 Tax=Ixodes scapularis TaxID=6945 RepID=B7PV33_IXOSC|nr:hypothetical protein IscW_ISCW007364 [Ixodes scapularis]|eukprot:XP_002407202.1 hypothetical protein IscW_ISCW007364 [Ixodes scapularis]
MPADEGDSGVDAMSLPESRDSSPAKVQKADLDVPVPNIENPFARRREVEDEEDDDFWYHDVSHLGTPDGGGPGLHSWKIIAPVSTLLALAVLATPASFSGGGVPLESWRFGPTESP